MGKNRNDVPGKEPQKRGGGQRVDQKLVDQMAALRRQAVSYPEIAKRVNRSVRTVQRYVKHVEPQLHVPQPAEQQERDPRALRKQVLRDIMDAEASENQLDGLRFVWYMEAAKDAQLERGPPSIRYLNEAERQFRAALADTGDEVVRFIASNAAARRIFVRETIGDLREDYRRWVWVRRECNMICETDWRPRHERTPADSTEVDNFWLRFGEESEG